MEEIDILMATYNGEKYIREQLNSVLNQTYSKFHIYIVDDCSQDGTMEILKSFEKKDKRITVCKNDCNIGSDRTFTLLLKKVKSNYFMFCDQDDIWNVDKIEKTMKKLILEDCDMVFTDLEVVDDNLNLINVSFNKFKRYIYKINKCNHLDRIYLYNVVTGCTILCKTSFLKYFFKLRYNNQIIHDYKIALVVSVFGKMTYLNESTMKYRQHESNQIGARRYIDRFSSFDKIREHIILVKINLLKYYIDNDFIFNDDQKLFNKKALEYFECIKEKKIINVRMINVFCKLYKNERIFDFISYFLIMNIPFIVKILYNLKKRCDKIKCKIKKNM